MSITRLLPRLTTLSLVLLLTGCLGPTLPAVDEADIEVFQAEMVTEIEGYTSAARIWAISGRLRVEADSGRAFPAMIADYPSGRAWALSPGRGVYQEFPIGRLNDRVPHFFNPRLRVEKKETGRELLEGRPAIRYEATLEIPGGRSWRGTLWEAEDLPGCPLQWRDGTQAIGARWNNSRITKVSAELLDLPRGYTEQKPLTEARALPRNP